MSYQMIELVKVANRIVETCMGLKSWEQVLLLTDATVDKSVEQAMGAAVKNVGAELYILNMRPPKVSNEEPLPVVREALRAADVYLMHMRYDIIHPFSIHSLMYDYGLRTCYMPALRAEQMLHPCVAKVDFEELSRYNLKVGGKMYKDRHSLRITDKLGTDVTMDIKGKAEIGNEHGICREPGSLGCQPPGGTEVEVVPSTANGAFVFEAYHMFGRLRTPIKMTLKNGLVTKIEGGFEATILRDLFKKYKGSEYLYHIGGPGTNPYGRCPGYPELIEDKHSLGPLHVGFGGGGAMESMMHSDGIVYKPTVESDGEIVEKDGVILVER